ncbi:hypothetical protein RF11_04240 [Thelohanellus kitauei]|uniref:Uncharacterized protein n=1 Tax=Thelohanellus kitauei TaxID=669202 RepID=A0A0C2N2H0_THEKT|nr:hypothetical protein RF11_04240 [Thelohanellus kitauei]
MVELKFMKDIPSPPSILLMTIILKYYDISNLSLVDTQEERYNLRINQCADEGRLFPFSYTQTKGKIIVCLLSNRPNEIPVLILDDMMSVCVFVARIVKNQDYVCKICYQVIKPQPVYIIRPNIYLYVNINVSEVCYVVVHRERRLILRLEYYLTSKPPRSAIVEVKIKLFNSSNFEMIPLYENRMFGWQISCTKHVPNSLIDNPVLIYDDSLQVPAF